jgi:hypothetical protein
LLTETKKIRCRVKKNDRLRLGFLLLPSKDKVESNPGALEVVCLTMIMKQERPDQKVMATIKSIFEFEKSRYVTGRKTFFQTLQAELQLKRRTHPCFCFS